MSKSSNEQLGNQSRQKEQEVTNLQREALRAQSQLASTKNDNILQERQIQELQSQHNSQFEVAR